MYKNVKLLITTGFVLLMMLGCEKESEKMTYSKVTTITLNAPEEGQEYNFSNVIDFSAVNPTPNDVTFRIIGAQASELIQGNTSYNISNVGTLFGGNTVGNSLKAPIKDFRFSLQTGTDLNAELVCKIVTIETID